MTESCQEFFRRIPSVDAVLRQPEVADLIGRFGRRVVIYAVRRAIEQMRHAILSGWKEDADDAILLHILGDTAACVRRLTQRHYRRVINAAGIVLHTNLGRAVLCRQAIEHLAEEMDGYSLLQVDLEEGKRSA